MSHTPHELAAEFPAEADKIHDLKGKDAHFAKLVEDYQQVNHDVHRAESRLDTVSEEREEELRKRRSHLKDQIWKALQAA